MLDINHKFVHNYIILNIKGIFVIKKKILWMKTIYFLNEIRSHLVTILPMALFTPKSASKLKSALHFRYASFPIANKHCLFRKS